MENYQSIIIIINWVELVIALQNFILTLKNARILDLDCSSIHVGINHHVSYLCVHQRPRIKAKMMTAKQTRKIMHLD